MSYFEEMTQRAKAAVSTAAGKAREVADSAKISAAIMAEKRELDKRYREIGQWYANEYAQEDFPEAIADVMKAGHEGKLEEVFGSGTAAVVSPIGELAMGEKKVTVSNNQIGEITQKLYDELTGIQWGRIADPHGWIMKL